MDLGVEEGGKGRFMEDGYIAEGRIDGFLFD